MEYKLIGLAKAELAALEQEVPEGKHIRTGDIRRLSAKLFRQVPDRKIGVVLELCNAFLEEHSWAMGVIAFDWAYRMRQEYSENTYDIFYGWLKKYVRGWGDCDDFCTHAFGELLRQNKSLFPRIVEWTEDPDFWVRRAALMQWTDFATITASGECCTLRQSP